MRIAVIGAGAMGGFFGGLLARAGEEVVFIARGAQLAALDEQGLHIRSRLVGDFNLPVRATSDPAAAGKADLVMLCVKTYDVDSAALLIPPLLGPDTIVLTLQNGVESTDRVGKVVGSGPVLCGISWVTANVESPGVVVHARGTRVVLGELAGGSSLRGERVRSTLERAGIDAVVDTDVRVPLWQKFITVCTAGGLSAATRLPLGSLFATTETRDLGFGLIAEVDAVARAKGIDLPDGYARASFEGLVQLASESPWAYPSLYHDLADGRRLELDALNGAVVRLGLECGVPTPLNFAVLAALAPYKHGAPVIPVRH
jgi:2-dehydropantoate 2-reductase